MLIRGVPGSLVRSDKVRKKSWGVEGRDSKESLEDRWAPVRMTEGWPLPYLFCPRKVGK